MTRWIFVWMAAAVVVAGNLGGCSVREGELPGGTGSSAEAEPEGAEGGDGEEAEPTIVAIDMLLVVDNSSSMGEEQNSLAESLPDFVGRLVDAEIDLRAAVVTTDGRSELEQGLFSNTLFVDDFTPNSFRREVIECLENADCVNVLGDGWACEPPLFGEASNLTNDNCSINAECRRSCTDDEECRAYFEDPNMICAKPGGDTTKSRCQQVPLNEGCPTTLPTYVSSEAGNLDLLSCLAIPGTDQGPNANLEQGLNAAVWALSTTVETGAPDRSAQAATFLRDDAHTLIIFISDEEDCSLRQFFDITAEDQAICGCLDDASTGGPLQDVSAIATSLERVGGNGEVMVAAIVGDVVVDPAAETTVPCLDCTDSTVGVNACVGQRRQEYFDAKCKGGIVAPNSKICQTNIAAADFGRRYIDLVDRFGPNGFVANICDDRGLGIALEGIADGVLGRLSSL